MARQGQVERAVGPGACRLVAACRRRRGRERVSRDVETGRTPGVALPAGAVAVCRYARGACDRPREPLRGRDHDESDFTYRNTFRRKTGEGAVGLVAWRQGASLAWPLPGGAVAACRLRAGRVRPAPRPPRGRGHGESDFTYRNTFRRKTGEGAVGLVVVPCAGVIAVRSVAGEERVAVPARQEAVEASARQRLRRTTADTGRSPTEWPDRAGLERSAGPLACRLAAGGRVRR